MISSTKNRRENGSRPFCQTTGCFDLADVYVVLKETEDADYYEVSKDNGFKPEGKGFDNEFEFDGFKMIIYMCARHDSEFKYLIRGSELRIAKRCSLHPLKVRQD